MSIKVESPIDRLITEPISVVSVDDGTMFGFTVSVLEQLLESARSSTEGRAIVFVQRQKREMKEAA